MANHIKIIGCGAYIPEIVTPNEDFKAHTFYSETGQPIVNDAEVIIQKFKAITGIEERRYLQSDMQTSDMAAIAAKKAIADAQIDPESIDYLLVAHNYGDVAYGDIQSDTVPSIASRVKHKLKIKNPRTVAFDLIFGCPGWLEAVLQIKALITSGMAKTCMVIGAESLSRVIDKHDRDSMIYSDGAGAVIFKAADEAGGVLNSVSATYTTDESQFIYFDESNNKAIKDTTRYIKMYGRKVYNFALSNVPAAMKECLDNSGIHIDQLKKILIHQANEKMDIAICERFYELYDKPVPEHIMPMTINFLGNNSVATLPILFDLIAHGQLPPHELNPGDYIMFASVGAGMNINAMIYQL
ncbi:MAG: 3-oxoacyl-[acyl-carrier-protein] synthase III C-terminal domain-containing protein [Flavobacteriaceae bacterium]|nr:3-oxoacyl-[acyl-carrier-protein] synthase III C-terminal domain-containing protein [Flavobacteriaceae bacterium]